MIKVRRGRASLREGSEELASLDAPDDEGEWRWPKRNRVAKRVGPVPTFQYLDKDDEEKQTPGGLSPGPAKRWKSSVDVEEGHCRGRLGGCGGRDAEKLVSLNKHLSNGEIKERKRLQGTRVTAHQERAARHVRQNSRRVCTQEHMTGCRREKATCVSISHHSSRDRLVHQEE